MRYQTSLVILVSLFVGFFQRRAACSKRVCNNSPALCDRAYNRITHLGAHDSPFVRNASNGETPAGNQFYPSTTQLDAGVRLLSGQVIQVVGNDIHLCHTSCALYDAGPLSSWLSGIKSWLDANPNDVVTILLVNDSDLDAATLGAQFEMAQIVRYAYIPLNRKMPTKDWPTLNRMIQMNRRLVIYIASLNPVTNTVAPYLLNEFTFVFENQYDVTNPHDFSCTSNRPEFLKGKTQKALASHRMPLMNHFLDHTITAGIEIPAVQRAPKTNSPSYKIGTLGSAARACTKTYGNAPTYILVDFVNIGPAVATVDRLNGVQGKTVGRKHLPDSLSNRGAQFHENGSSKTPSQSGDKTIHGGSFSTTTKAKSAQASQTRSVAKHEESSNAGSAYSVWTPLKLVVKSFG